MLLKYFFTRRFVNHNSYIMDIYKMTKFIYLLCIVNRVCLRTLFTFFLERIRIYRRVNY